LSLIAFSFGMLLKILWYARVQQYGFAHAMPAALIAVVAMWNWLPRFIAARGGSIWSMRSAAAVLILSSSWGYLRLDATQFAARSQAVGQRADQISADQRGAFANDILEQLRTRAAPGASLAVFPEGAMLNFLARRVNPTPYPSLMPTELSAFGEVRILEALRKHPPDYIVLAHRDTSEFAVQFFGRDYAQAIGRFIAEQYRPLALVGSQPLRDQRFGLLLLGRKLAADGGVSMAPH
jgi:hypothetical protein